MISCQITATTERLTGNQMDALEYIYGIILSRKFNAAELKFALSWMDVYMPHFLGL